MNDQETERLFLAIAAPESLREALLAPLKRNRDRSVKPSPPSQLHITLRFLGEVEKERRSAIEKALAALPPWKPFSLSIEGAGLLPSRRQPKILYAGVAASNELLELKRAVDEALLAAGLEPESGKFRPHLTMARFKDSTPRSLCESLVEKTMSLKFGRFVVESFGLHSSRLLPSGAVHRLVAEFKAKR